MSTPLRLAMDGVADVLVIGDLVLGTLKHADAVSAFCHGMELQMRVISLDIGVDIVNRPACWTLILFLA